MSANSNGPGPSHSDLSIALAGMMARVAKRTLADGGLRTAETTPLAERLSEDMAWVFTEGGIRINGKSYRPTVQFVAEDGQPVPAEAFPLHGYARDSLKFADD